MDQKLNWIQTLKLIAKFALVGGVFWFLNYKGLLTLDSFLGLAKNPRALATVFFLVALNTLAGTLRWQVLLDSQGVQLRFLQVLRLNLVGNFFNIALPGAVSGDVVKAVIVAQTAPQKRAECFGSILFDRILGVTALVVVASFSTILANLPGVETSLPSALVLSVLLAGLGVVSFFVYLFLSGRSDPLGKLLHHLSGKNSFLNSLNKVYVSVLLYRSKPARLIKAILLSLFIHTVLVTIAFTVSYAIAETPLPFLILATIVPIGMLATAIPVLPAGVGTGHAAFYALFKMSGSEDGIAVFNWIVLTQIIVGVVGGAVYLVSNIKKQLGTELANPSSKESQNETSTISK